MKMLPLIYFSFFFSFSRQTLNLEICKYPTLPHVFASEIKWFQYKEPTILHCNFKSAFYTIFIFNLEQWMIHFTPTITMNM